MGGFLSKIKATGNGASAAAVVSAQIAANPDPVDVTLSEIQRDPGRFLMRQRVVRKQVDKLKVFLQEGKPLDPVDVFRIDGVLWLVHGHHRYEAHAELGLPAISCVIREGTLLDAMEFAWPANGSHGEALTDDDNRIKIASVLKFYPTISNTELAKKINCSVTFVGDERKRLEGSGAIQKPIDADGNEIRMVTRGGKTYAQKVGGIGKNKPQPTPIKTVAPSTNGHHVPGDGKIAKTIRLTAKEWDDLRGLLAGSEIGRVVMEQIGG